MAYETIILLPQSRVSNAGGASGYAGNLVDRGILQSWDLAKGCPGLEIRLYPAIAGVVKGDYEGYREKILTGFITFGYAPEKPIVEEAPADASIAVDEPGN